MGEVWIEGFPYGIQIEGDTPNKEEMNRIDQLILKLPQIEEIEESKKTSIFGFDLPSSTEDFLKEQIDKLKKKEARTILEEGGMYHGDEKLPPLQQHFGIERDDAFIGGGMFGSWPGLKDLFKLKNIKYADPKRFLFAGGKTLFGGIFGSIAGAQAVDIANFILSGGDNDFLPTWKQLDKDTQDAIFWESLSLGLPEVIPAIFRGGSKLKDPAVQKVIRAAERLGIDLDLRFITRYGGLGKALGPLPMLGGVVRKGKEIIGKQLNTYYNRVLASLSPVHRFTDMGHNIYDAAKGIKAEMKKTMGDLWNDAYKLHALLPDKNIFRAKTLTSVIDDIVSGNIFKLKGSGPQIPRGENGVILSFDDLVQQGWFKNNGLSRLEIPAGRDFFTVLRQMQETIHKQGGEISYQQINKFKGQIDDLFTDFSGVSTQAKDFMSVVLSNLYRGSEDVITIANMNKDKLKLVDDQAAETLIKAHNDAMNFTKNTLKLWEGDAASIFGKYSKNFFKPGFELEKKTADQLFAGFMSLKSPEQLKQVKKLIGKENYQKLIDEYLSNALQNSLSGAKAEGGELMFDVVQLGKQIGYDKRQAGEFWEQIFKDSSVPKVLIDDLMEMGGAMTGLKIGDPSTFLQRRLQLTGIDKVLNVIQKFMPMAKTAAIAGGSYGIFGPIGPLITILGARYGFGKLFANPGLAKKVIQLQDMAARQTGEWGTGAKTFFFEKTRLPQLGFKLKFGILRDLLDVHLNEIPSDEREAEEGIFFNLFNDIRNSAIEFNSTVEEGAGKISKETLDYLREIRDGYTDPNENPAAKGDLVEDVILDEQTSLDVPQVNQEFDMASVLPSMPNPAQTAGNQQINPEIIAQLDSVGMPLFGNEGGIASLMQQKKPQQMVA